MDLPDELAALARGLADRTASQRLVSSRRPRGGRPAAVLALFALEGDNPDLTFIERAHTMRKHAGQMAFPGGAVDDTDADAVAAALREASEEVGLDPRTVDVLGEMPAAHVAASGFDVTTVAAWWRHPHEIGVRDPAEVASVHRVGIDRLVDPELRRTAVHPSGYRGPAFVVDELFIWGLTAHLVDALLELGGWQRPWDRERSTKVPERLLRDSERHGGTGADAH
ncbi:CoA pyrophosphatase [Mariniluteicoccus endophyticus]